MSTLKTNAMLTAENIASALITDPHVDEVQLFGSVARDEEGNDTDLILIVSDEDFERFVEQLNLILGEEDTYVGARTRFWAAELVLDWVNATERITTAVYSRDQIDVFLLPKNWLGRIKQIHDCFTHEDPEFTRNIAHDTRRFDPATGEFEEVPAHQQAYCEDGVSYTYSLQFGRPAIVIDGTANFDKVVKVARKIGAVCDLEESGTFDYVVEFRNTPDRLVGPELYVERALRETLDALN